ncbi:MAG: V-containing nitrogenase subunit delta [Methylocystaceae bacterium]|nr:MAG: V-containing nitrogenase subunit delta [Methylocystaceae bacterium]
MSEQQIEQLFDYVQKRYLWQFFSRAWDRQENIDGIIDAAIDLLHGKHPKKHTPMDRLFYADAKEMVKDFKENFPWIDQLAPTEVSELLHGLKNQLVDHTISRSLNHELNHTLY